MHKSFTCTGGTGKLQISIYHYMEDIKDGDSEFDYDISVSNLTRGSWEEASEKYRDWATEQTWCTEKGTLDQRTDVDKTFHENTTLINFSFPYASRIGWEEEQKLYRKLSDACNGHMFNILLDVLDPIRNVIRDNGDRFAYFELNTFIDPIDSATMRSYREDLILDRTGNIATFTIVDNTENNGRIYYYGCPGEKEWLALCADEEKHYYENYQVSGYYHDLNVGSDIPRQCFDTNHAHGTRINVISDFVEQERQAKEIAAERGVYNNGGELIIEQLIPYLDYYQCRSNAGLLSWQEHDRIRYYLENGYAEKVPMFEYVYHGYGAVRMDGYMNADARIRDSYYYVMAFTALNGGIPEYNYEFVGKTGDYCLTADKLDEDMLDFLGKLGATRTTYGKDFLVYGQMKEAPDLSAAGKSSFVFFNVNRNEGAGMNGQSHVDNVVATAYTYKGNTAVFLCNITDEPLDVSFLVEAEALYGVSSGTVSQYTEKGTKILTQITDGKAKVSITLPSREIIMLTVDR